MPQFPRRNTQPMRADSPTPAEVRSARDQAGLTQAQAAELAGYGAQSRWAELEAGRRTIDPWRWRYFLHRAGISEMRFTNKSPD